MKKIKGIYKNFKRQFRELKKKGILGKVVVIVASLALLATSVLPYIL